MKLPKAVTDAAKASEDLQQQLIDGKPQEGQPGTPDGTPTAADRDTLQDGVVNLQQQPDTPEIQPEPEETWKQRYLSLQGKYNAQVNFDVPVLQTENRNLRTAVQDLQAENNQLKAGSQQNQQESQQDGNQKPLDPSEYEAYGPEFSNLIETINTLEARNKDLSAKVQDLSGDVIQSKEDSQSQRYNQYMTDLKTKITGFGSDFDALNSDAAFLNFLRQYPQNGRESRHDALRRAEKNLDLSATLGIFKEYLSNPTPPAQNSPNPTPTPNIQPPADNPGSDTNPPVGPQGKIWTRAEISGFYQDKIAGKYKGKEEEAARMEADIHIAPTQGRVA